MIIHDLFVPKDVIRLIFGKIHAFDFMAFRSTCKDAMRCLSVIDESELDYGSSYFGFKDLMSFKYVVTLNHNSFDYLIIAWIRECLYDMELFKISESSIYGFYANDNNLVRELYSDYYYDCNDVKYYSFDYNCKFNDKLIFRVYFNKGGNSILNNKLSNLVLSKIKKNWRK